ncbi:MAG: hypothetical protein KBD46_03325 [Candidatus Levybacteria bacterium]|nr:hypothetical protein [Candidatus Levybacteria bacterium]
MNNKVLLGYLMIFLSALFFASYGIWAKLIGTEFGIFFQEKLTFSIIVGGSLILLAGMLPDLVNIYSKRSNKSKI